MPGPQGGTDPALVRRLWRPVTRPGVIDVGWARARLERHGRMVGGLPLAELVARYTGTADFEAGLPIVYGKPTPVVHETERVETTVRVEEQVRAEAAPPTAQAAPPAAAVPSEHAAAAADPQAGQAKPSVDRPAPNAGTAEQQPRASVPPATVAASIAHLTSFEPNVPPAARHQAPAAPHQPVAPVLPVVPAMPVVPIVQRKADGSAPPIPSVLPGSQPMHPPADRAPQLPSTPASLAPVWQHNSAYQPPRIVQPAAPPSNGHASERYAASPAGPTWSAGPAGLAGPANAAGRFVSAAPMADRPPLHPANGRRGPLAPAHQPPLPPAHHQPAVPEIDLDHIVDVVHRRFVRRLAVEAERRGGSRRW